MVLRILLLKKKKSSTVHPPLHKARIPLLVKQANKLGIPQTVPRGVSMESIKNHMKCGEKSGGGVKPQSEESFLAQDLTPLLLYLTVQSNRFHTRYDRYSSDVSWVLLYVLALPSIQIPYQLSTIPTLPCLTSSNGISILDLSVCLSVDDETPTFPRLGS